MAKIKITDESNDRAYFTIVPNLVLNHSTGDEQALYAQMKRFAGENKKCFASLETLAKRLKWGEFKVRSNIKKLLARGWIKKAGTIPAKTRPVNAYIIIDIWKTNVDFYKKEIVSGSTVSKKGKDKSSQHGKIKAHSTVEEKHNNKKNPIVKPFSFTEYLKKMMADKNRHIRIIGWYIIAKRIAFENQEQIGSFIKRNLRAARILVGYNELDINYTMTYLNTTADFKWTLETVSKYIDEMKGKRQEEITKEKLKVAKNKREKKAEEERIKRHPQTREKLRKIREELKSKHIIR